MTDEKPKWTTLQEVPEAWSEEVADTAEPPKQSPESAEEPDPTRIEGWPFALFVLLAIGGMFLGAYLWHP